MIEDVIVKNIAKYKDPYDYYYKKHYITNVNEKTDFFNDIEKFYIGDEIYDLTYNSRPLKDYNRIAKWDDFNDGMRIIYKNGEEKKLNRKEYIKILKDFGKPAQFFSFEKSEGSS